MLMLTRRLQVLLDDERYLRLAAEAERRSVAVAVVVREAIDAAFPADSDARMSAGRAILQAARMPVPEPAELRREIEDSRGRGL